MTEAPLYTGIEAVVFLLFFGDKKNSFLFFYSTFLLMCLEETGVVEVALLGRRQMTYLVEEIVIWDEDWR